MLRLRLAAGIMALALAASQGLAQQSGTQTGLIGLPVYSSDGQKLGQITEVGTSLGRPAVRADMDEIVGIGPRSVVIAADIIQQWSDRVELTLSAAEVRARLFRQKQEQEQGQ